MREVRRPGDTKESGSCQAHLLGSILLLTPKPPEAEDLSENSTVLRTAFQPPTERGSWCPRSVLAGKRMAGTPTRGGGKVPQSPGSLRVVGEEAR